MDDASPDLRPAVPWALVLVIALGLISLVSSIQDEAWNLVAITAAGILGLVAVLGVTLWQRSTWRDPHPNG